MFYVLDVLKSWKSRRKRLRSRSFLLCIMSIRLESRKSQQHTHVNLVVPKSGKSLEKQLGIFWKEQAEFYGESAKNPGFHVLYGVYDSLDPTNS